MAYCHPYFEPCTSSKYIWMTIVESGWNVWAQVQSMDDNCGELVECMGVASGCGEQEAGVATGSG